MFQSLMFPRITRVFRPSGQRYQCHFKERDKESFSVDCAFGDLDEAMSYVSLVVRFLSFIAEGRVVDAKQKQIRFICHTPVPFEAPKPRQIREVPSAYAQLALEGFDSNSVKKLSARHRKVEETFARLRQLHDELNQQLYTNPAERPAIHAPKDAFDILHCFMSNLDHEELWVVCMDTRNRVMRLVGLYKGSVNSSQVRIAEVFRQAILDNAPAIIVAHNHPSGDPSPSPEDVSVTRAIVEAGKLLDIQVLDHVVVGRGAFVSLKERGLGFS